MLSAKLHRSRGGRNGNFEHGHHDVARGDLGFARVDGGGVEELIGAHVEDDEILAPGIEDDEAHSGGALGARCDKGGVHPFGGIKIGRDAGEFVGSDHG